ncbi:MAG: ABC transporter ATP-binding protein [Advenella sp.]
MKNILFNRHAALSLGLVVIHQSLIALSALFLTQLITAYQTGEPFSASLFWYLFCMITPFLPGCLSLVEMQKWTNDVHKDFIELLRKKCFARPDIYTNINLRNSIESAISRSSFSILSGFIAFIQGSLTFLLNSGLSLIVIGIILPNELIFGYLLSVVISIVSIAFLHKPIARETKKVEQTFANYGSDLARVWSNTILGNVQNFDSWSNQITKTGDKYYEQSLTQTKLQQTGNLVLGIFTLLPTAYLVYSALVSGTLAPAVAAAIIVNLTRVFHILNSLGTLVYQLLDWSSVKASYQFLFDIIRDLERDGHIADAPVSPIKLNDTEISGYAEVATQLAATTCGRFTLRGENGSGKSTLLLYLKKHFTRDAFYLPASMNALVWNADTAPLSTGQSMLTVLHEITTYPDIKYFLLDEWDANLDKDNKAKIHELLDELSKKAVVLEVRH